MLRPTQQDKCATSTLVSLESIPCVTNGAVVQLCDIACGYAPDLTWIARRRWMPLKTFAALVPKPMFPICRNCQAETSSLPARPCFRSSGSMHAPCASAAPRTSMARPQGERCRWSGCCCSWTSSQRAWDLQIHRCVTSRISVAPARMLATHRRLGACSAHARATASDHAAALKTCSHPGVLIWTSLRPRSVRYLSQLLNLSSKPAGGSHVAGLATLLPG